MIGNSVIKGKKSKGRARTEKELGKKTKKQGYGLEGKKLEMKKNTYWKQQVHQPAQQQGLQQVRCSEGL